MLKRDVVAALRKTEAIPTAPFDAAMVKDHRIPAGKIHRAFAPVARDAFAEAQEAHDDIMLAAKGNRAAINHHAGAGRGLTEQRNIAAYGQVGLQGNDPADIKHHYAVRVADGFAQRASSRIRQAGDMH